MYHQYHHHQQQQQHHRHFLQPRSWPGLDGPGQHHRHHGPALVEEEEDDVDDDDRDPFSYYYSCDDGNDDDNDAEYRQARQVLQEFHRAHSLDVIYERPHFGTTSRTSSTPTSATLLPKTRTAICLLDLATGVAEEEEEEEESTMVLVGEDSISSVSPSPSANDFPSPPSSGTIPPLHCRREGPPPMTHTPDGGGNDDWGYFREDEVEARTSETGAPSLSSFRKPSSAQTLPYHQHRHFQRRLKRSIRFSTQY